MSWQIIKQPNGKYAIWSHVTDSIVKYNLNRFQTVHVFMQDFLKQQAKREIQLEKDIQHHCDQLDKGLTYHAFSMTWEEALSMLAKSQGQGEVDMLLEAIRAYDREEKG